MRTTATATSPTHMTATISGADENLVRGSGP
jgi:hypothetical protein